MNANGAFREDELVSRKVKINGECQIRTFPVVGVPVDYVSHRQGPRIGVRGRLWCLPEQRGQVPVARTDSPIICIIVNLISTEVLRIAIDKTERKTE